MSRDEENEKRRLEKERKVRLKNERTKQWAQEIAESGLKMEVVDSQPQLKKDPWYRRGLVFLKASKAMNAHSLTFGD
jgi:hypothetical protein